MCHPYIESGTPHSLIMNKSQEITIFSGLPDFHHETDARKMMIDFKFDALYR